MNWLKNLCASKKVRELEEQVRVLQAKLKDRQEAINKTNAFWKKKLFEMQQKTARQKKL